MYTLVNESELNSTSTLYILLLFYEEMYMYNIIRDFTCNTENQFLSREPAFRRCKYLTHGGVLIKSWLNQNYQRLEMQT